MYNDMITPMTKMGVRWTDPLEQGAPFLRSLWDTLWYLHVDGEDYKSLVHLLNKIPNVAYYYELNYCLSHVKQLAAIDYTGPFSTPVHRLTYEVSNQLISKVQSLSEQTTLLEGKLTDMLESLNQLSTSSSTAHLQNHHCSLIPSMSPQIVKVRNAI